MKKFIANDVGITVRENIPFSNENERFEAK